MNNPSLLPVFLFLLSFPLAAHAQLGRNDLDDIERHRKPRQAVSVLSTVDGPDSLPAPGRTLIGSWDFLDAEERMQDEAEEIPGEIQRDYGETFLPDSIAIRLGVLPAKLRLPYDDVLSDYILNYMVTHKRSLQRVLGKYFLQENAFRQVFERYGVPGDITALSIVESALNPTAVSRAGAAGTWQLMPMTAMHLGLTCDSTVDERFDPVRSTEAAARYLAQAYRRFGNWPLAIASYNCGPGAVEQAIRRAGTDEFWPVYQYLPEETRGYMPAFTAVLYALWWHDKHGMSVTRQTPPAVKRYRIKEQTTFRAVSALSGCPVEELQRLNPQYIKGVIPKRTIGYILTLPSRYAKQFENSGNTKH